MRTMGSTLVGKHENKINFECTQMNDMCIQRKRIIYVVNMLIGLTLLPLSNFIRSPFCICWDRRYFLNYFTVLLYSLNPKKKAVFLNRVKVDEGRRETAQKFGGLVCFSSINVGAQLSERFTFRCLYLHQNTSSTLDM